MCDVRNNGFTLVELSIVLVLIGLLVGGVLVGQDLIRAASVRAQISQIEKYNAAVNTFRDKYGALPGDMNAQAAVSFGFAARGQLQGQGDGNGVLEGSNGVQNGNFGWIETAGASVVLWNDLSQAKLIDGSFVTATETGFQLSLAESTFPLYFPQGKIGNGNYLYAWSGGPQVLNGTATNNGINYFGLSIITSVDSITGCGGCISSAPGLTVSAAESIDKKIDDGYPQLGNVVAFYPNAAIATIYGTTWAAGGGVAGASDTSATQGSPTTCYDNGGTAGATQHYSVGISNGSNVNCGLSFRFQ